MTASEPSDVLTEAPVQADVLRASAALLELLSDFFTADYAARTKLAAHLVGRRGEPDTNDTTTRTALVLAELDDAAELLHALAGDFHPRTTRHH